MTFISLAGWTSYSASLLFPWETSASELVVSYFSYEFCAVDLTVSFIKVFTHAGIDCTRLVGC